jgi:hypothetical protein
MRNPLLTDLFLLVVAQPSLFLAMLLGMSFDRLIGMRSSMNRMPSCGMSVMCRFLMVSGVVVLRCFPVMPSSIRVVLRVCDVLRLSWTLFLLIVPDGTVALPQFEFECRVPSALRKVR